MSSRRRRRGRFAIYPIDTVDQGLELLTGIPAGQPDAAGNYPVGTLNQRIAARLDAFAAAAAELARAAIRDGERGMNGRDRAGRRARSTPLPRTAPRSRPRRGSPPGPRPRCTASLSRTRICCISPVCRSPGKSRSAVAPSRSRTETAALQLRAAAERTRQELVGAANRHRIECTFEIVQGTNATAVAGASQRDLVVAGGLTRPIAGHFQVEHRWRSSVKTATGPFLLARSAWTAPGSVAILLRDRDAASARLFETAAQIAAARDSILAVLCTPTLAAAAGMEQWIAERAATHGVQVQIEAAPAEPTVLRERLGQLDCRVIALNAKLFEGVMTG